MGEMQHHQQEMRKSLKQAAPIGAAAPTGDGEEAAAPTRDEEEAAAPTGAVAPKGDEN